MCCNTYHSLRYSTTLSVAAIALLCMGFVVDVHYISKLTFVQQLQFQKQVKILQYGDELFTVLLKGMRF